MNNTTATAADVKHALAQFTALWNYDCDHDNMDAIRDNADECLTAVRELALAVEAYRDAVHATPPAKPTLWVEVFTDDIGADWLIPSRPCDLWRVEETLDGSGLVEWVMTHPVLWEEPERKRFEGFRLNSKNLEFLRRHFDIEFRPPTIDQ